MRYFRKNNHEKNQHFELIGGVDFRFLIAYFCFSKIQEMKKAIACFFVVIFLFSGTELYQVLKFPKLLEHFIEHRGEKRDITFYEFLALHYAGENNYDADYDKDMKLPFKMNNEQFNSFTSLFSHQDDNDILHPDQNTILTISPIYNFLIPSTFSEPVWQPPRFC